MTREEAIEELQYIKDSLVSCELSYDALDMAIESLSADVVEVTSGKYDCVSREKVRDLLHEYMNNDDFTIGYLDDCYCEMPSLDVRENVKGEWELVDEDDPSIQRCSVCKAMFFGTSNFCANCGAEMGVKE